jgi:hypothetical protein
MSYYITYTYKTHYYCTRGCGPHDGWIKHGEERINPKGMRLCPFCGNKVREQSRHRYGKNRIEEPPRID